MVVMVLMYAIREGIPAWSRVKVVDCRGRVLDLRGIGTTRLIWDGDLQRWWSWR